MGYSHWHGRASAVLLAVVLLAVEYVATTATAVAPSIKNIPVLMYHSVDEVAGINEQLYVKTSEFERQMRYLRDNGFTPVWFGLPEEYDDVEKPVIITFDDGYEDNYLNAYPILKEYYQKAVIFLVSGTVGTQGHLNAEEISEMSDLVSFQSHTVTHPDLDSLTLGRIRIELALSKKMIERLTGRPVSVLAYPYGSFDNRVLMVAARYYDFAVTVRYGCFRAGEDTLRINRVYVKRSDTIGDFATKLSGGAS